MFAKDNTSQRRARSAIWAAGAIAAVVLVGAIATDVLEGEISVLLAPYRGYAWIVGLVALLGAVGTAMWLKAAELHKERNPALSFEWSLGDSDMQAREVVLVLPGNMFGSWPLIKNTGPGSERIERMTLDAHIFKEYPGSGQTVSVAPEFLHWTGGDADDHGLKWERASAGRWTCGTPFTLAEQEEIALPPLQLRWDEQDVDAHDEVDRLVGASDIRLEFDLSILTMRQTYSASAACPLRVLRPSEAIEDGGADELAASLFPQEGPERDAAVNAYETIQKRDFDIRDAIAKQLNEVFAQKAMETVADDLREIDEQLDTNRSDPKLHLERARILTEAEAWPAALRSLELARGLDENSPGLHLALAKCYLALGRPEEALGSVESQFARAARDAATHHLLGCCLAELGRHEEAVKAFENAIALEPYDIQSQIGRADSLRELDRNDESVQALLQAIESGDVDPRTRISLALSLALVHRDAEALSQIQAAIASGFSDVATLRAFSSLLGQPARRSLRGIVKALRNSTSTGPE